MDAPGQLAGELKMLEYLRAGQIDQLRRAPDVLRLHHPDRGRDRSAHHLDHDRR